MLKPKTLFGIALAAGAATALSSIFKGSEVLGMKQSEKVIKNLHPSIQPLARELLSRAANDGLQLVVTSGLRTNDEQARLFAQGRTAPGPVVTAAKPGTSWHNYGLAFDVAVLKNGNPTWPNNENLWLRIGNLGRACGLRWGGDFGDRPHFEYHPDLTIAEAVSGKRPKVA